MTQKLRRNTSDPRWRKFWKGVDAAAERAPRLQYEASAKKPVRVAGPTGPAKQSGKQAK